MGVGLGGVVEGGAGRAGLDLWCAAAWVEASCLISRALSGACLGDGRDAWGGAGAGDNTGAAGVEGVGRVRLMGPAEALGVKEVLLGVPACSQNTEMSNRNRSICNKDAK